MNKLQPLGTLALGSRIRSLLNQLDQGVREIYRQSDLNFEPRWFPVVQLLKDGKSLSISDIAQNIGQTHQSVNQVADALVKEGLVRSAANRQDARRRDLTITTEGREMVQKLTPLWNSIDQAARSLLWEAAPHFLEQLRALEDALARQSYRERIEEALEQQNTPRISP